jgi:hypothetical protein
MSGGFTKTTSEENDVNGYLGGTSPWDGGVYERQIGLSDPVKGTLAEKLQILVESSGAGEG